MGIRICWGRLITLKDIENRVKSKSGRKVIYGAMSPWWYIGKPLYRVPNAEFPLPCDPRGGLLLETDDLEGFLKAAKDNVDKYGKYGLDAFMLAYHGNVITDKGLPTCLKSWKEYNDLIDKDNIKG